ncbi:hypothetical protein NST48_01505 [Paenibacillus sp. FSL M7-0547]|uniref:hypothetical protein n=1 Tax=Paenibacillus sp. FSL M7-0547 TaxID=2954755 RepID=UPI0030F6AD85
MSMTPEQIEDLKRIAEDGKTVFGINVVRSLLAALEESKQEGERLNEICKQLAGEEMLFQDGKYETEMQRVQGKLAEAQQTIARQREALKFYASRMCIQKEDVGWNVGFIAREALRATEEGGGKS